MADPICSGPAPVEQFDPEESELQHNDLANAPSDDDMGESLPRVYRTCDDQEASAPAVRYSPHPSLSLSLSLRSSLLLPYPPNLHTHARCAASALERRCGCELTSPSMIHGSPSPPPPERRPSPD
eukprot:1294504-Rhodomonas_salina.1